MSETQRSSAEPTAGGHTVRSLGLLAATALVVANMIGTGVFTSTGFMVPNLASGPILINWLIGGVLALCGAAAYAELGAMMPRVGGEYVYIKEAYHPALGFLSGWISLIVGFSAPIAASSIAFGAYLNAVTPVVPGQTAAVSLIIALTALHMIDLVFGSRVQTGFTILKVLLVVGFIVAGLSIGDGDWSHLDNPLPSASSSIFQGPFFESLVFVSFSYSGWNAAAYVAGEIRDPGRILPRALILGTAIVTVLYIGLNVVFLYAAPAEALAGKEEIGAIAAVHLFGAEAGQWLSTCIALALVSSVSAMVMAGPRVYTAMAEDRLFFHFLAARNQRGAPVYSVLLQGMMAILFTVLVPFETLLQYIGFTLSIFAALAVTAVFILRARFPDAPRPYRTWGWPVSPLLFIALSVWMVVHLVSAKPIPTLFGGGATVASGLLVYFLWQWLTGRD